MESLPQEDLARLSQIAYLPKDYLAWLARKGWGEIGSARYMLYSSPIPLQEVHEGAPAHLWAFGDDFAGYCGCFSEKENQGVIEWESSSFSAIPTGLQFSEYIARYAQAL
jgi:hypothetical protein